MARPGIAKSNMCADALKTENSKRNRYRDVLPYDDTRVRLVDEENDYINASHVFYDSEQCVFKYIAAQGPTEGTADHFWQMVWENQVRIIAMVTTLVEKGEWSTAVARRRQRRRKEGSNPTRRTARRDTLIKTVQREGTARERNKRKGTGKHKQSWHKGAKGQG